MSFIILFNLMLLAVSWKLLVKIVSCVFDFKLSQKFESTCVYFIPTIILL